MYYRHTISALFILAGTLIFSASCGGPAERIRETSIKTPSPAPTVSERLISGNFNVEGASGNEAEPYKGSLTIAPKGDVYEFRWSTNRGSRVGVGVQIGDAVASSFAATGGGEGCGAILYKIASDGSLEGKIARWGEEKFATEKANRVEGTGFVGKYTLSGTSISGEPYTGEMTIKKNGGGYEFERKLEGKTVYAFGTWQGSVAAASFGGNKCGFALYDLRSNGDLEGHWGSQRAVTIGTESAKRN